MKTRGILISLLVVAGCSADPPPKLPPPAPATTVRVGRTPTAPPPAACLPKETKGAALLHAELNGTKAELCYEPAQQTDSSEVPCAEIDVGTGAMTVTRRTPAGSTSTPAAPDAKKPAPPGTWVVTTTKDTMTVCKNDAKPAKGCLVVKAQHKPIGAGHGGSDDQGDLIAAVNADGTRVFVFAPELKAGADRSITTNWTVYGDTYDTKSGKRLFHQKLTHVATTETHFIDPTNEWSAWWVGKNIVLGDYVCCGPGGTTFLFDPEKGTTMRLHGYAGSFDHVDGSTWAAVDGKKLSFVDVDAMADLGAPIVAPGATLDDPEDDSASVSVFGDHVLFAFANPPGYFYVQATQRGPRRDAPPKVLLALCP